MALLVFAIVVVLLVVLLCWAIDLIPAPAPTGMILKILVLLVAVIAIANRAGLL